MELEDVEKFQRLDPQDLMGHIHRLPTYLADAWALGQTLPLPSNGTIQQIVITAVGDSAIAGDLLAAYIAPSSPVSVHVERGYDLPAWARGPETLVIAISHS